jgi:hypothetical protein
MRSPQTEATPAHRQPPIKVTFDTNTLSDVVDPDQQADCRRSAELTRCRSRVSSRSCASR